MFRTPHLLVASRFFIVVEKGEAQVVNDIIIMENARKLLISEYVSSYFNVMVLHPFHLTNWDYPFSKWFLQKIGHEGL